MDMNCTCLKPEFDDMTLQRTMRGEIREGWKEEEWVAWRIAEPRIRDNMTIGVPDRSVLLLVNLLAIPGLIQSWRGYKVVDYSYNLS
jgi:hypothetical protein